jgi:hypothetical protein
MEVMEAPPGRQNVKAADRARPRNHGAEIGPIGNVSNSNASTGARSRSTVEVLVTDMGQGR